MILQHKDHNGNDILITIHCEWTKHIAGIKTTHTNRLHARYKHSLGKDWATSNNDVSLTLHDLLRDYYESSHT